MAGHIRTLQKCPKCRGKFSGAPLHCPICLTIPTRYFLDLWWRGRLKIYSDNLGQPLFSWEEADQLLSTIRHQIPRGKFDPAEYVARELRSLQFDNCCRAWLDRRAREVGRPAGISRGYFRELRRYAEAYFIPYFHKAIIRELRKGHLIDFKNSLPAHLSPKTVANILGALHQLLADAFDRRDVALMPGFPKVPQIEPEIKWLPPEKQERILAHCREPYRTFYLLCMKHGPRLGEVRALKWSRVNLKDNTITICASFDRGVWVPFTKERRVRIIPLHSRVREAILALPRSLSGFVFVNRAGRPLSETRVRAHWLEAAAQAGIEISCYQGTRHSFCTQKLMEGFSSDLIMAVSGHKTKKAFDRYGKLVTEALRPVVEDENSQRLAGYWRQ